MYEIENKVDNNNIAPNNIHIRIIFFFLKKKIISLTVHYFQTEIYCISLNRFCIHNSAKTTTIIQGAYWAFYSILQKTLLQAK